ncbi:hypothetical protein M8C21_018999 [Ambrosia artemisiifolia]|uniref:Uncharacterized protein n=1 Tax=Ambrosia artemisiifolia TaxID=4212 RepID=A0AAD5GM61_AMBAR|nr:hypothetical protein M8C21_018999 [Ambrosia artemisiifolia]
MFAGYLLCCMVSRSSSERIGSLVEEPEFWCIVLGVYVVMKTGCAAKLIESNHNAAQMYQMQGISSLKFIVAIIQVILLS